MMCTEVKIVWKSFVNPEESTQRRWLICKKMKLLTKEQQQSHEKAKICCICKEKFETKCVKDNKYCKDSDNCHYTG